ncbi:MAG: DNA repair ATPase [Pseudomonadota bacterium]
MDNEDTTNDIVTKAVTAGGAYEVIQQRLVSHGDTLAQKTQALNTGRTTQFGATQMALAARTRVRTENNCVGRDIVQLGDLLLFGFNVFIGLKTSTSIDDVFALYRPEQDGDRFVMHSVALSETFLAERRFKDDFDELYRYYKETRLIQLVVKNAKLLASFQIGERLEDVRVFRWSVSADGKTLTYIDNRGERDIEPPAPFDFEWTQTTREDIVHGRFPHINVLDTLFVETTGGDLTIKIEDNTTSGEGIYGEAVEEENQSLDDAQVFYARVGDLVLLRILPYKESVWRHFVYNTFTNNIKRIDAIGDSCIQLPEDHGLIFPGGYYLQDGETRSFGDETSGLRFKRKFRSPNGEDVLYVFYEPDEGIVALLSYNLITKTLQNPIVGHGYALADDGTAIVFNADVDATRIHPMQIWQTPYVSDEFASRQPVDDSFYARIGNAELVRGVSDLYSIVALIRNSEASVRHYEALRQASARLFDNHFWIDQPDTDGIGDAVRDVSTTVELVIDEFEKVDAIRRQSEQALKESADDQQSIRIAAQAGAWKSVEDYVETLDMIRKQRGHLATIREYRYIDTKAIDNMDEELVAWADEVGDKTAQFLSGEGALTPYRDQLDALADAINEKDTVAAINTDIDALDSVASGLDLLSELIASLKVDDATVQTAIVDSISSIYAKLNQTRARARQRRDGLGAEEATAQFAAQFTLLTQNVENALAVANTPERCDEQLTRLLVQVEELESRFSENESFLPDIMQKREEIYETFEAHKQRLLDQRQKRAQTIADAISRMLDNVSRRTQGMTDLDELNTYLASDPLVLKTRDLIQQLRELDSAVKADDAEARLRMLRDQAVRALRDKKDLYLDDGRTIKLGSRHQFSVNTENLDVTLIPRDGDQFLHLVGTQYFERIDDPALTPTKMYWDQSFASETQHVYRGEYLAYQVMNAVRNGETDIAWSTLLTDAYDAGALEDLCRRTAAKHYKDGYEKGIHDSDAARILGGLLPLIAKGDLLRFSPQPRALAQLFWVAQQTTAGTLSARASAAAAIAEQFEDRRALVALEDEATGLLIAFVEQTELAHTRQDASQAAAYLIAELAREEVKFVASTQSERLLALFKKTAGTAQLKSLASLLGQLESPARQFALAMHWLGAMLSQQDESTRDALSHYAAETAVALITGKSLQRRTIKIDPDITIHGLFAEHSRIEQGEMPLRLDTFLARLAHHCDVTVPGFQHYLTLRREYLVSARETLRLDEFKPRPLSSFVRNRLINEVYLPIIGDNLAKQIGTAGDSKRSDLSGLLMMISPPGYGKTTLMEYVASRLGLTFVKINGPALGHHVTALDPETAPESTSRNELEKLNLAFEMGDNVMLYLDDIQHTNPEFLQKFISLCDSTRRVEGVWKGKTKTYDLRGRKFCVVMAGNPYTESGETFRVPDMLANRADIYNLGDVLSGREEQFEMSYLENSLTSNAVLAPLATRDIGDVYHFIDMARGRTTATTDLSHEYSAAEVAEITKVLQRMFTLQSVILKVNQQYIASAAQEDKYRVEPRFLLQGSYRNMNKLAEKVSAVMNDDELEDLLADHYRGEAQLLTQGTEANLLKLAELRSALDENDAARWAQIKADFLRDKAFGGDEGDVGNRIAVGLSDLVERVGSLGDELKPNGALTALQEHNAQSAAAMQDAIQSLSAAVEKQKTTVNVTNKPSKEFGEILTALNNTIEHTLFPLVRSMDKRIAQDIEAHDKLEQLSRDVQTLKERGAP